MKITPDTDVLLRLVLGDDESQGSATLEIMKSASRVAISVYSLCELAWVLRSKNAMLRPQIAHAIRRLIELENVVVNLPVVEAGLAMLDAGGDFADGVIAFEGQRFGAETFVSFDKKAVKILNAQDVAARLIT